MAKEFWTRSEVIEIFKIQQHLLAILEEEEIVCPRHRKEDGEKLYSPEEMELLRITKILMDELDVNLPGVDIILRMRHQMIDMRRQVDDILADLVKKLRQRL
ncbi:MAG: MerR family transcriptional regulator [Syntrophales bacterium]|jgi:MerR family transcriptional regulator/heat shock protein HspR|nr:MerR family transcriptional regulator [Syntrophales bacterium]MCK9527535.1 MerR family transcriptional regulator [Syntrophales bacterium]MDX9922592.1 chaperone modulator CbpM [Syntrophales bacterium]